MTVIAVVSNQVTVDFSLTTGTTFGAWDVNIKNNDDGKNYSLSDGFTVSRMFMSNSPTHYVAPGGGDVWPYTNWLQAAHTLQHAVETAINGDKVIVSNGVYDTGGDVAVGYGLTNRVYITSIKNVRSVNGYSNTMIVGAADPVSTNGPAAVRCAPLSDNSSLTGFTLTNGHSWATGGDPIVDRSGGGILLYAASHLSQCMIAGCEASVGGGGLYCSGGGSSVRGCMINDNTANVGGGVYCNNGDLLQNCTIVSNSAVSGGGIFCNGGGEIWNSIIWGNTGTFGENWSISGVGMSFSFCNTTPLDDLPGETGCISNDPLFVDAKYHLSSNSPCIDAGSNTWGTVPQDLDHMWCPLDGNNDGYACIDIGAFEFLNYDADSDGDGLSDGHEVDTGLTIPTQSDAGGIAYVNAFPGTYDLHSSNTVISLVTTNPGAWGLFTSNTIMDLNMGQMMLQVSNGQMHLDLQIEETTDLQSGIWSNAGSAVQWQNPAITGKLFYRVWSQ